MAACLCADVTVDDPPLDRFTALHTLLPSHSPFQLVLMPGFPYL